MKSASIWLLVATGLSLGGGSAWAQSGLSGIIVYRWNGNLRILHLESGQDQPVTNTPELTEYHPRFSPDGTLIACGVASGTGGFGAGMHVMDLSGNVVAIPANTSVGWQNWSPDGQWIAWSAAAKPSGIYVTRFLPGSYANTTIFRLIDHGSFPAWAPTMAPGANGSLLTKIAFTSSKGIKPSDDEIWLMTVTITANGNVSASGAARILIFKGWDGDLDWKSPGLTFTHGDIFRMNPTAANPAATVLRLTQLPTSDVESRWSPDGTKLLFRRSAINDPTVEGLWVIDAFLNPDGSFPPPTLLIPGGGQADWGP